MNFIGIIPARYASTRFPGKPLVDIKGKSMIQRVYEQVSQVSLLSKVIVATDDSRIFDAVIDFGGHVVMTANTHASGTDRCYEAATILGVGLNDVVLNIQGDEPFISPLQIEMLCSCFTDEHINIGTLIKKIDKQIDLENNSTPKVIVDVDQNAIYFSRSIIPNVRGKKISEWLNFADFYKHIGIYAYRMKTLSEITNLSQSKLELIESLEQLRWIENGFKIKTAITNIESFAIDTPQDLDKLKDMI